jgi:predicted kinase
VVIIRGNSASGKSSTAHALRRRYGCGCSLIEQDYLRRVVLREHGSDATPTVAPAFIMTVAQAALAHGYHLVLEGILHTRQYGEPLRQLIAGHPGPSFVFWLQVSLGETVRRHQQRAEPVGVTPEMMAAWYTPLDLLGVPAEQIIGEDSDLEQTVLTILHASGLAQRAALTPCPLRCPRCAHKRQPDPVAACGPDSLPSSPARERA